MKGFVTKVAIKADKQGAVPTTINLLKAGSWNTPWHGDFELTSDDLQEMVAHFDEGVGLVEEQDKQAPVNYGHLMGDKAAGWMKRLYTQAVNGTVGLFAEVEWTPAAEQAIKDGEWKYISPEFNPRGCPWEDPEQEFVFVENVLTGAALTNIPLFKKLKPITASRIPNSKVKASAAGDGDKQNKGESMTLEDIRAKEVADLTDEEKAFLSEHKADLTAEELVKYELEATDDEAAKAAAEKETAEKEAADKAAADEAAKAEAETKAADEAKATEEAKKIEASAVHGITAEELEQLRADAKAGREAQRLLARKEAEDFVAASVKAGQIKSGESDKAVELILASSGKLQEQLKAFISSLPKNDDIDKELGDAGKDAKIEASTELKNRVAKVLADARAEGKHVSYAQARRQVLDADEALKTQLKEEEQ